MLRSLQEASAEDVTIRLGHIFRHPVKGLSPEALDAVELTVGCALPLDRRFAIAHGRSAFDPGAPAWLDRRNFLNVAHYPRLAALRSSYDGAGGILVLHRDGEPVVSAGLGTPEGWAEVDRFLRAFLDDVPPGPPGPLRLAEVPGVTLTDSPLAAVSVLGLASLREVERAVGRRLDVRRFRGNLWIDGGAPWQEFDWLGRELAIGDARLRVVERIERCAATNADPDTGERDANVPLALRRGFGHADFGVLAEVTRGGVIGVGEPVRLA